MGRWNSGAVSACEILISSTLIEAFFFICRETVTDNEVPNFVPPPALHLHVRDSGSRSVHPISVYIGIIMVKHACWWRFIVIIQHRAAAVFLTKPSFPIMGTNGSR